MYFNIYIFPFLFPLNSLSNIICISKFSVALTNHDDRSKETPDINVRPLHTQVQQTHTYMEGKNLGPNPGSNSVQLCEVHKVIDHVC